MITEKLVLFIMKSSHYDLRFDDDSIRTILLYDYVIHLAKTHHGPGKIKNTTYCIHLYATCILQFQTWFTHIVFRYLMICSYCRKVLTFTSNHISPVRQLFTCPLAIQQSLMEDHHFLNTQIIQPNGPWRPWLPARLVVRNYQDQ